MQCMGIADDLPLVDHHCHSINLADLELEALSRYLTESPHVGPDLGHLDAPLGLAVRRWCPPLLNLEPFCSWEDYAARRLELGGAEVAHRLLGDTNSSHLLIDGGYRSVELASLDQLREASGAEVLTICRIETLAQELAADTTPATFLDAFTVAISQVHSVGFKSVVAYRCGFDHDWSNPSPADTRAALERWFAGGGRVEDPMLEAVLLNITAEVAAARAMPIQFHVGLGDPDVELHRSNPSMLASFIAAHPSTVVTLLHCWPFEQEASFLTAAYPNVRLDVGLSLNYVGPAAPTLMARALELGPFGRHLYASDAFGVAELYCAGAHQFRWALGRVVDGWIADGSCTTTEAERIAHSIASTNALRTYGLT
jgi:uncharacterized protein